MSQKKQGFIQKHILKPTLTFRKAFGFIPLVIPFIRRQKTDLDEWSAIARKRLQNPAKSNFELGMHFYEKNSINDAITRFKIAIYMNKNYADAHFWLGKSYLIKAKNDKAIECFEKAKELGLSNEELDYFYKIYNQQQVSAKPTTAVYKLYFDKFAEIFDEYYIENFTYIGHEKIASLFFTHNEEEKATILDLGCGVGLLGKKIKERNQNHTITGLDFSKNMLDHVKTLTLTKQESSEEIIDLTKTRPSKEDSDQFNIYSYLIKTDLLEFTNSQNIKYHAVLARGIFNYIQDFKAALSKVKEVIKKDGIFIFYSLPTLTLEQIKELETEYSFPFFCNHYSHSETTIKNICKENSFKLITSQDFNLEKQTKATIFVFKRI